MEEEDDYVEAWGRDGSVSDRSGELGHKVVLS